MSASLPSRGDVWLVDLDPTRGHEQAGTRPALVVSVDPCSQGPAELAIVVPITTRDRAITFHVQIAPGERGLSRPSFAKFEDVRSVSRQRLVRRLGRVSPDTISAVEQRLRVLLGL